MSRKFVPNQADCHIICTDNEYVRAVAPQDSGKVMTTPNQNA